MKTHASRQPTAKTASADRSPSRKPQESKQAVPFTDNRPAAAVNAHLQETANNSPQAKQLKAVQEQAANAAVPVQLQSRAPVQFQKPKSAKTLLADRIGKEKDAKTEIEGLLTAAGKRLPDLQQKEKALYTDAMAGGYSMLNKVIPAFLPHVPRAQELIRSWANKAKDFGKKANGVKFFLKKYKEGMTAQTKEVNQLLKHYYDKTTGKFEATSLATAYMGLKEHQKDSTFDDSSIDPQFLDATASDNVKTEISGGGVYDKGSTFDQENNKANAVLEQTKSMTPSQRYYTIARYCIENRNNLTDYRHRTALILEAYLKSHLRNYMLEVPVPPHGSLDAVKLTNGAQYTDGHALMHDSKIYRNIQTAWATISRAVSPSVLQSAGQCTVKVSRRSSLRDYFFMRAFASNREMSVGENWTVGQIQHEFGHHLEDYGKTSRWLKLQQLLHERSKGQDLKSIFPVSIPGVINTDELQYKATMPASTYAGGYFGYSAKYYDWGSTELVSTVLEVWNKPDNIINIALNDPDLFLAVLGVLRE